MIRIICLFFSISHCLAANGQQQIDFIDNDLPKALKQAEESDRLIFVDAYTTWCGPCKMMDKSVFTDEVIADFFNDNFVNLKLDMEKGEGIPFRSKYGVRAFPSFLFLNAAGVVVHRGLGFQPPERFLALGKAAVDPEKQTGMLGKAYAEGERNPEKVRKYALALLESGDEQGYKVGADYLNGLDKWTDPADMSLVASMMRQYDDPYFKFMVEKRHLFIKEFGTGPVDAKLAGAINQNLYSNIESLDLDKAREMFFATFPTNKATRSYRLFEIDYYKNKGSETKHIEHAQAFVKANKDELDWSTLNGLAWGFYEDVDDRKALKSATKWAKQSVAKNSNYYNTDTLAALYYKLGKRGAALRYARKAVGIAQALGLDYGETTKLLEKIQNM